MVHQGHAPWVNDDQLRSLLDGPHDFVADHRVGLGRVGTRDQDAVGIADVTYRVGHGAAAKGHPQTGDGAGVAETGAMIHVIGAKAGPHEFLEQIVLFVRAAGRGQPRDRVWSVRLYHLGQPGSDQVERRLPRDRHEVRRRPGGICLLSPVLYKGAPHQGLREPVGVGGEVPTKAAFDAQELAVDGASR